MQYPRNMAFKDFTCRVHVDVDNRHLWEYCDRTFGLGHWGKMYSNNGKSATYCFEYETDALMFMLQWPDA